MGIGENPIQQASGGRVAAKLPESVLTMSGEASDLSRFWQKTALPLKLVAGKLRGFRVGA